MIELLTSKKVTQGIRLLDMLVIGPVIIASSAKRPPVEKTALMLIGIGTIVYNGVRFFQESGK